MDDSNAYEPAKFGSRYYENNQYNYKNHRRKTTMMIMNMMIQIFLQKDFTNEYLYSFFIIYV